MVESTAIPVNTWIILGLLQTIGTSRIGYFWCTPHSVTGKLSVNVILTGI
jgi:hypothetical protein